MSRAGGFPLSTSVLDPRIRELLQDTTVSHPWDFPLFVSPGPGAHGGPSCLSADPCSPTTADPGPQGSHNRDTTWLWSIQCARLSRGFPRLSSPMPCPEKEGATPAYRPGPRPHSRKPAEGKVDSDSFHSLWIKLTSLCQATMPEAFLLTHWILSAIVLLFS